MKLKNSTKFRIVTNGDMSFYTTAKQIRDGVGSSMYFNTAVIDALLALENVRKADVKPIGLLGSWIGYNIQIDIIN
jgi:hypothetical protein